MEILIPSDDKIRRMIMLCNNYFHCHWQHLPLLGRFLACTTGLRTVPLGGGKDQGGYMQSLTLLASTSLRLSLRALVRHFTAFEAWTHHYHCLRL